MPEHHNGAARVTSTGHTSAQTSARRPSPKAAARPGKRRAFFPPPPARLPARLLNPASPVKVAAVIPCFNRPQDLELLLADIARADLRGIELWCVIVDNASPQVLQDRVPVPPGLRVEFIRSPNNSGGSGGFNLGIARVMSGGGLTGEMGKPEFLWWLDSDARVSKNCLRELVRPMLRFSDLGAVGSALGDRITGTLWEIGGTVFLHHGGIGVSARGDVDRRILIRSHFVAACSALVRTSAVEATGLFPENFIYYDDVQWALEMRMKTGMRVMAAPRSKAYHPPSNSRFATWTRYYMARNCYSHIDLLKLGGLIRWKRARSEAERVASQFIMGIDELGEIRLAGLRDAVNNDFTPREPKQILPKPLGFIPLAKLPDTITEQLAAAEKELGRKPTLYVHPMFYKRRVNWEHVRRMLLDMNIEWPAETTQWRHRELAGHEGRDLRKAFWRMLAGPTADVAVVPTGWPSGWFRGRVLIQPTSEGVLVRRIHRWKTPALAFRKLLESFWLAYKISRRGPRIQPLTPCPAWNPAPRPASQTSVSSGAGSVVEVKVEDRACSPSLS